MAYEERPWKIVSKLLYRDHDIVRSGVELMCTPGLASKVFLFIILFLLFLSLLCMADREGIQDGEATW